MNPEIKSLALGLSDMAPLVEPGTSIPRKDTPDHDLAVVATGLLRKAYVQGLAVRAIAATAAPEGAVPNLRSMLEALGELHFLTRSDNRHEQARIAFLYALREFRDFYVEQNDPEGLARVEAELLAKGQDAPTAYEEAMKRKNYWIPKGRAKIVEEAIAAAMADAGEEPDATGRHLYKLLSWDEHHVMAALLSIQLNPDLPAVATIKKQDAPETPEAFIPFMAVGVLASMLKLYFELFPETKSLLKGAN